MIEEKDVKVRMRDGVDIGLRIYRPDGSGRYPALFAASPYRYDNNLLPCSPLFLWRETGPVEWYVEEQGYAYVHADVRGSGTRSSNGSRRRVGRMERSAASASPTTASRNGTWACRTRLISPASRPMTD